MDWTRVVHLDSREGREPGSDSRAWHQSPCALFLYRLQGNPYYLLFQSRRPEYINGFVDKLVDWRRVEQRYQQATKSKL